MPAPKDFVGREFAFDKINQFLANPVRRVLLIQGEPGFGKTAVIQKFVSKELRAENSPLVYCFKDLSSQDNDKRWIQHLYASVVQQWQLAKDDQSIKNPNEDLVQRLRNRIAEVAKLHPKERMLFVIDAVDEAGPAKTAVVSFLRSEFPGNVQVIATARRGYVPHSPRELDIQRSIQVFDLDGPDGLIGQQSDARRYAKLKHSDLADEMINQIVRLSDGNFLILRGICRELQDVPSANVTHHLRELGELVELGNDLRTELYERTWQRLERLTADELRAVEKVAALLAVAHTPLSERIIKTTLGFDRADWVKVHQHFHEYLDESQRHPPFAARLIDAIGLENVDANSKPVPVFSLFHQTLKDFVRQHLDEDNLADSKKKLADYCREQLKKRKPSYEYAYALRFGPAHLMRAAEDDPRHWDHLEELLTDISFLEAKTQAGFVFELADDLTSAWQTMPADRPMWTILKLLAEAIRREIHFIDEHAQNYPQGLFQCLWNLAWWYGNPDAAPYYQHADTKDSHDGTVDDPEANGQCEAGMALVQLLERWLREKKLVTPGFHWLRSRRPPDVALGGEQLTVIPESRGGGWWVDCSANGKRIAGGGSSSWRVWDAETLTEVARMPEWVGQKYSFQPAAISPDGNTVIVACGPDSDLLLVAWDIRSDDVRTITNRHKHHISEIAFSPDGTRFATASWSDTCIRIWDAKTFDEVLVLDESDVYSLCFSLDGKRIISGSDAIRIWDASNGQLINDFAVDEKVGKVCISPDGKRIATNSDNDLVILNAETGDELVRTPLNLDHDVDCMCFSPDGKRITSSNRGIGLIRISDAITGKTIRDIREHEVGSVCYLPDGKRILSGSFDGTIRIWNAESEPSAAVFVGGGDVDDFEISGFCFLENGKKLLCDSNGLQHSLDGQSGIVLQVFETGGRAPKYSANSERCGEFCPTGDFDVVQVRDTRTGKVLFHRRGIGNRDFNLSPDGERISFADVTLEQKHVVRVFDAARGQEFVRLNGHESTIQYQCFSADGARIATASQDRTVRIWNAITGELLTQILHDAAVRKVWFSPDGTQIVSFDAEGALRLCDSATGHEKIVLDHHEQEINDLCFSPAGARVVAEALGNSVIWADILRSADFESCKQNDASGYIFIWDAKTGELVKVIAGHGDIQAIAADVEDTSFRLMVRDGDTIVETATGQIAARYPGTCGQIATHPDGRTWAGTFSNYLALIHLEG